MVRSTYEDREGTLWVCTVAGLDAFDRRTEKVTERIRLNVPESLVDQGARGPRGRAVDHLLVRQRAGLLGSPYAAAHAVFVQGSRAAGAQRSAGAEGIHEDADGNLWLATRGSGLVKIDRSRQSAVRYRHSPLDPQSISDDMLMSVFEDREGSIWVGTATTGVDRFQRKPLPFKRYRHEPDNPQSLLRTSVTSVYADSQENIWVGSALGLTRIDGKSGEYSFFRKAGPAPANLSNTFVISIVEDRSGYLWFGTYGGLNRYDPRTGRFAAFRHNPADPHSLSHDIVYSLMVDHQGTLWAGTADGLSRLEDPATGRFRSWKAEPAGASPQEVRCDRRGSEWSAVAGQRDSSALRSGDRTLHRLQVRSLRNGKGGPGKFPCSRSVRKADENSFLTIDHSGVLWVATTNGLVRFDREREQFTIYDERDGLPASSVHGILEDRNGNLWVSTAGRVIPVQPTHEDLHQLL